MRQGAGNLVDLAALFAGKDCDPLFADDGIHFDHYQDEPILTNNVPQPGLMRIAAEFDGKIRAIVQGPEWQRLHGRQP